MKILVIGGGGREHAICWKINQNPDVEKIYCIPGNGGIDSIAKCCALSLTDFPALASFVRERQIDFSVVGPEQPLANGLVDYFQSQNLPVFGPAKSAARMESSKIFAKNLMTKYHIPTAQFQTFNDPAKAHTYLKSLPDQPLVVKADGLAAGKGVMVCKNLVLAKQAVKTMMTDRVFSEAGSSIILEECLTGEEVSIFAITDGKDYVVLSPAQDFKRALDNDKGKNTGGMGSYGPTPFLTEELRHTVIKTIIEPTLEALMSEAIDYRGVLYCGLMLTPQGPKVIEFNCRFGDPETQVVLPLLKTDLLEIMQAVHHGTLGHLNIKLKADSAICVALASGGYPDAYQTGKPISGLDKVDEKVTVFHAGTQWQKGQLVTSGGRVMGVTAWEDNLLAATRKVYQAIAQIHFENMHFRNDIARRAGREEN